MTNPVIINRLAQAFAIGRIGIGATFALAPDFASRNWLGEEPTPTTKVFLRGMGSRDAALGLGTLFADPETGEVSRWLLAHAAAEAADAIAVLLVSGHVPKARRVKASVNPAIIAMVAFVLASAVSGSRS